MSYRVTMDECNFYIKSENLSEVLKRLANSDFVDSVCDDPFFTKKDLTDVLNDSDVKALKYALRQFFAYKKYEADYDEDNNIVGLYHTENTWEEDTAFFAVFADLVEAGSYIVFSDEEYEIWRIHFLGEDGCEEENGKLVFPDHTIKKPKNTYPHQLGNHIILELEEFEDIVCDAIDGVTVKYTLEGLDMYTDEDCVSYEEIKNLLTKHFGVEVTSFHSDHCEDNPGVWVCYKDGSEAQ